MAASPKMDLPLLVAVTLLLLDKAYIDYATVDRLSDKGIGFVTRTKTNGAARI